MRKAVRDYLTIKLALITVTMVAALSRLPLPVAPVQIVILELFAEVRSLSPFLPWVSTALGRWLLSTGCWAMPCSGS